VNKPLGQVVIDNKPYCRYNPTYRGSYIQCYQKAIKKLPEEYQKASGELPKENPKEAYKSTA